MSQDREIIENDGRYTIRDIAKAAGISLSRVYFILKRILKVRKIFARWIPHLLTDEQKRVRAETAKQLIKIFSKVQRKAICKHDYW